MFCESANAKIQWNGNFPMNENYVVSFEFTLFFLQPFHCQQQKPSERKILSSFQLCICIRLVCFTFFFVCSLRLSKIITKIRLCSNWYNFCCHFFVVMGVWFLGNLILIFASFFLCVWGQFFSLLVVVVSIVFVHPNSLKKYEYFIYTKCFHANEKKKDCVRVQHTQLSSYKWRRKKTELQK